MSSIKLTHRKKKGFLEFFGLTTLAALVDDYDNLQHWWIKKYKGVCAERNAFKALSEKADEEMRLTREIIQESTRYTPKPLPETLDKNATIIFNGLKQIAHLAGTIQDKDVLIYQFMTADACYYLQVNYDGELMRVLQEHNDLNAERLLAEIKNPCEPLSVGGVALNYAVTELEKVIETITVKDNTANTLIMHELTEREKMLVDNANLLLLQAKSVIVTMRKYIKKPHQVKPIEESDSTNPIGSK